MTCVTIPPRRAVPLSLIVWCKVAHCYRVPSPSLPVGSVRYVARGGRIYSPRLALSTYQLASGIMIGLRGGQWLFVELRDAEPFAQALGGRGVTVLPTSAPLPAPD